MSKNLRHVLRSKVFAAHKEGTQKHALSKDEKKDKVFSYGQKHALLDLASAFGRWAQERGCKTLSDLSPEVTREFLESKAASGCRQSTLDLYRSELGKIGDICGVNLYADKVTAAVTGRDKSRGSESVISKADYDKLLAYADTHPSGSGCCILLEKEVGVRVSDMAYGLTVDRSTGMLHIRSKGGRVCDREITPAVEQIIERSEFKAMLKDGRLHAPKDASINKYLLRTERRLGLEEHSFHDLRRYAAQEKYDEYRRSGMERHEALCAVGEWLNHGSNRADLVLKSYVAHAW